MAKPNVSTQWAENLVTEGASGNPNRQEPSSDFKLKGQPEAEPTDRQSLNYRLYAGHKRMEYLDQSLDTVFQDITDIETVITEIDLEKNAMSVSAFFSLAEQRRRENAGSGFLEWGLHYDRGSLDGIPVNQGFTCRANTDSSNKIYLGWNSAQGTGDSRTEEPQVLVNGVLIKLANINDANNPRAVINLPPAPDGTKTYDSDTGIVTTHADSVAAFASETATNKVITSRKDLVFLEVWHEAIEDKNQVYYLGNVQFDGTNPYGVAQFTRDDGYTRFGEWDVTTTGNYCNWSTMTDAEKILFINDKENNIYYDSETNQFIQVRYRVRVVEGLGDAWARVLPFGRTGSAFFDYSSVNHVRPQGMRTTEQVTGGGFPLYATDTTSTASYKDLILGSWGAMESSTSKDTSAGYKGKCFALPIALVQRLNQGAYHPTYNPQGTKAWVDGGNSGHKHWYELDIHSNVHSTSQCFGDWQDNGNIPYTPDGRYGYIDSSGTGRTDQYDYHDAIYAGLIEDLRLSALKLDVNSLSEALINQAHSATIRGKQKVPYLFVAQDAGTVTGTSGYNLSVSSTNLSSLDSGQTAFGAGGVVYNLTKGQSDNFAYLTATNIRMVDEVSVGLWGSWDTGDIIVYTVTSVGVTYFSQNGTINGINLNLTDMETKLAALNAEYDDLPWVDVVGDPARIAATFPEGVIGEWVPELPDGVKDEFLLNRKAIELGSGNTPAVYTINDGSTWSLVNAPINEVTNKVTRSNHGATQVSLIYYKSLSDFTVPDTRNIQTIPFYSTVYKLYYSSGSSLTEGNRLQQSLTGKVGTNNNPESALWGNLFLKTLANDVDNSINNSFMPTHEPIDTLSSLRSETPTLDGSSGVKIIYGITEKGGLYYMIYIGQEVVVDNTSFFRYGDTGLLDINSGEVYVSDINNTLVKSFAHSTAIPVGIVDKTETSGGK